VVRDSTIRKAYIQMLQATRDSADTVMDQLMHDSRMEQLKEMFSENERFEWSKLLFGISESRRLEKLVLGELTVEAL
jgi:hypothetical protein